MKNDNNDEISRWLVFSSCLYIAGSCGMSTAYGLLTPSLEGTLHLQPSSIALIGSFGNIGSFSGIIAGVIIETIGAHLALYVASALVWFGLFFIWLTVVGILPLSLPALCIYIYLAQLGASTTSQTSSSTALSIFPNLYRYKVASIAKGYSGIAGAIISAIAGSYFELNPNYFILFASTFIPLSIFAGSFTIPDIPEDGPDHFKEPDSLISLQLTPYYYHFFCLLFLSISTALFSYFKSEILLNFSHIFGTLLVIWLATVYCLPKYFYKINLHNQILTYFQYFIQSLILFWRFITCQFLFSDPYACLSDSTHNNSNNFNSNHSDNNNNDNNNDNDNDNDNHNHNNESKNNNDNNIELKMFKDIENNNSSKNDNESKNQSKSESESDVKLSNINLYQNKELIDSSPEKELPLAFTSKYNNLNVIQMIQTPEFWLIFTIQSFHYGGTLFVINLIESIVISYDLQFSSFYVFLIGCFSSIGRITSGHLLEYLFNYSSNITPESLMGICCLMVSVINMIYSLYIPSSICLIILISCTGYLHGIMGVLSSSSVITMYGRLHVATNDGIYDLSGAVGSYLISYTVVTLIIPPDQDDNCHGAKCYQQCFTILSVLCFIGFLLSLLIKR